MKIAIGNDHVAVEMKREITEYLKSLGHEVVNYGTDSSDRCDYPVYGEKVARAVAGGEAERGILICGTGIGMSMAANKHNGIRAACCSDTFSARLTREHNDANVLCFGERVVGVGLAIDLVDAFLDAEYLNNGNHVTRVAMLKEIENKNDRQINGGR